MTKTFSVLALAVALLIVALALMVVGTEKVRAKSTCPSGTQKFAHVCIENGPARTAATFANASATCAAAKRRLPTSAALDGFRQQPGGAVTVAEWSSDFTSATTVIAINAGGSFEDSGIFGSLPFRCVA